MKELQELRIVFQPDGVQYHVTYSHGWDDKVAAGSSVAGRKMRTRQMALGALRVADDALRGLPKSSDAAWLFSSTNYIRTTDSIEVDR